MKSIIILIPALNEKFIKQTIDSAIQNSSGVNKIKFAILEQSTDGNFSDINNSESIRIEKILTKNPIGVGAARSRLVEFVEDEDFFLGIDSHTIFTDNWDNQLINRYSQIVNDLGNKTLISQPLHWATIEDGKLAVDQTTAILPPWKLKIDGLVAKAENISVDNSYEIHHSLSCHFMFGYASIVKDIPFDKELFFIAEEPLLSIRYASRGYNLVAINYNPMYHLSKYSIRPEDDWKIDFNVEKTIYDALFLLDVVTGKYLGPRGAESIDSLNKYKLDSGMTLKYLMDSLSIKDEDELYYSVKNILDESFSSNNVWSALYDVVYNLACKEKII